MGGAHGQADSVRRNDGGAALVEMALVLPLLVMLLFGIVSAGMAYNHQLALTHAAREAARFGATLPITDSAAWLNGVRNRAEEAATGSLTGAPGARICVAYVEVPAEGSASWDNGSSGSQCFTESPPRSEGRVQVRVEREVEFNAIVFQSTLTLSSEAVNRFEAALGS